MKRGTDFKEVNPTTVKGPQGNDKAPGEDPAGKPGTDNKTSLKGKKVDADPSQEEDQPVDTKEEA
jgi:hypothetical protein